MKTKMKKIIYIPGFIIALFIVMTSCNRDMNELHEKWLENGEIDYVGKIDSIKVLGGNERIEFQSYLSDPRVKSLNVSWTELGVDFQVKVPVPERNVNEMFSFVIGETQEINENEYTFTIVSDDGKGTQSIPFKTIGKVYGSKYQQSLSNRLVVNFEEADGGIYLEFSSALNSDDQGIELKYNNGTENLVLNFTAEELNERIFLISPDFSTPINYSTIYQPKNSIDTFKKIGRAHV